MRITIGGALIVGVMGSFSFLTLRNVNSSWVKSKIDATQSEVMSLFSLFKSGEAETKASPEAYAPPAPLVTETKPETAPVPVIESQPIQEAPAPVVQKKPAPKKTVAKKKAPVKKKTVAKKTAPKKTSASSTYKSLEGTYVDVKLDSGRTVKGIFRGEAGGEYKVELPGLGEFTYPQAKVTSITKAK